MIRRCAAALGLLLLAACQPAPAPAPAPQVALWAIGQSGNDTIHGWIIGTVHALPPGTAWRRPAIDAAMAGHGRCR